jgi:hypothetical protein
MKKHIAAPDPKIRREFKRAASVGLALFAAGVMALIYVRTL